MKRVAFMAVLMILCLSASAGAITYSIPELPDFPEQAWTSGSYVEYSLLMEEGASITSFDLRIAITATVTEGNTTLYWIEFDLDNLSGMPDELAEFFYMNYGELPEAVRFSALIPWYDLKEIMTDPSTFYYNLTAPGFIRGLLFQYNDQTPYDVDPNLLGGFIFPLAASEIMGEDLPEDFLTARNLGINTVEDPDFYNSTLSESQVTVEAGTFDCYAFSYSSNYDDEEEGTVYYNDEPPILPILLVNLSWVANESVSHMVMELNDMGMSGARTEITGDPVPFDLYALMNYGMQ